VNIHIDVVVECMTRISHRNQIETCVPDVTTNRKIVLNRSSQTVVIATSSKATGLKQDMSVS
jgi:hypothetical protein